MVLYVTDKQGTKRGFPIRGFHDFYHVYDYTPGMPGPVQEAVMSARNMDQAISKVISALANAGYEVFLDPEDGIYGSHDSYADVTFSKSKPLPSKVKLIAATGMAAAGMLGAPTSLAIPTPVAPQEAQVRGHQEFGKAPEDHFLWTVSQVESNGDRNKIHPLITKGMHKGDRAIGMFGLMPKTVMEFAGRLKREGAGPEIDFINSLDSDKIRKYIMKNPKIELHLARAIAKHVLQNTGHNYHRAAYMWNFGHNKEQHEFTDNDVHSADYVHKFKRFARFNPIKRLKKAEPTNQETYKERFQNWQATRAKQKLTNFPQRDLDFKPLKIDDQVNPNELRNKIRDRLAAVRGDK